MSPDEDLMRYLDDQFAGTEATVGQAAGEGAVSTGERTQLVRYDAMCRAIAEAHAVDEVKDIGDKARAIEAMRARRRTPRLNAKPARSGYGPSASAGNSSSR
jgi:hypothetical protein